MMGNIEQVYQLIGLFHTQLPSFNHIGDDIIEQEVRRYF